MTTGRVKGIRRAESSRAAAILRAEIRFFDSGDYPLRVSAEAVQQIVEEYRELQPAPEQCEFKPQVLPDVTAVWETKRKGMESMEAQTHLWQYYTQLGKRRGTQAVRNSGNRSIQYAGAFQRVYPQVTEELW